MNGVETATIVPTGCQGSRRSLVYPVPVVLQVGTLCTVPAVLQVGFGVGTESRRKVLKRSVTPPRGGVERNNRKSKTT